VTTVAWDNSLPGERPASESDAKKGRESGLRCELTPDRPIQSGSGEGEQADAARSAARPAALPCLSSNNYPKCAYSLRKTVVTYQGIPGSAREVTCKAFFGESGGLDREGRDWLVEKDGVTWSNWGARETSAEAKRAFALRNNLKSFFDHYGRDHCAFFTLSPLPGTEPKELAGRFNDARKREFGWMLSYVRVLEPRRDGTAHHHYAVATKFDMHPDLFDWAAFKVAQEQAPRRGTPPGPLFAEMRGRYSSSATPELRDCWKENKAVSKAYGLGRVEMLPIRTCAVAMGHYVGKYLASGTHYRNAKWKGARRVEYDRKESLLWKSCGSAFGFVSEGSREWRKRVDEMAMAACVERDDTVGFRRTFGRTWAYDMRATIMVTPPEEWREHLSYFVEVYDGTMPPMRKALSPRLSEAQRAGLPRSAEPTTIERP